MLLGCLSFIPLAYLQSGLTMNRSLSAMFSPNDPAIIDYQRMQAQFGGNLVVMWVYDDDQLMTTAGLARSRMWTARAESIEGVEGVLSLAKLVDAFHYLRPTLSSPFSSAFSSPFSSSTTASAQPPEPLFRGDDPVAAQFRNLFAGYTHSPDEKTAAIVVMLHAETQTQSGGVSETIAQLRRLTAEMPPSSAAMLVGEPVLLEDAFDLILADGRRLAIGTIGLLCVVILLTLRDLRVVALSAICIVWSAIATRAMMVVSGVEMSLVSTILLALIAVIVVAAIMHLAVRYRAPGVTLAGVIGVLAIPIACTCLTDVAGFASLMISHVRPVAEFGAMTATAACCVLISIGLFSPSVLSLPDWLSIANRKQRQNAAAASAAASPLHRLLRSLASASIRWRNSLTGTAIVGLIASTFYVMGLETNSSFLANFRPSSPIVRSYKRVEDRLGGAGVWDVTLPAPTRITPAYLQRVRNLEEKLRDIEIERDDAGAGRGDRVRLRNVLSLADADAVAEQVTMLSFVPPEVRLAGMRAAIPTFAEALLTFPATNAAEQPRRLRIMLRSDESLSGPEKTALMAAVTRTVEQATGSFQSKDNPTVAQTTTPDELTSNGNDELPGEIQAKIPGEVQARVNTEISGEGTVTGYSVLMSRLVASLVGDQWTALTVALAAVGLLLVVVTADWRLTLVSLIVNTLPILVVLSCMGWLGGQLDLGSAMIGAVSIGLSIDGSIHFLSGYQRRRFDGQTAEMAATESAADLGAPILLASAALVIGFAVLVTSPFVPTATFGLLVAATLTLSAIANLTLLPAMVVFLSAPLWKTHLRKST